MTAKKTTYLVQQNNSDNSLRNMFVAALAGVTIAGGAVSAYFLAQEPANNESDNAPIATNTLTRQTIKTIFVNESVDWAKTRYENDTLTILKKGAIHTETMRGQFPADQAYRYNIVVATVDDRKKNELISFTSPTDLLRENSVKAYSYSYDRPIYMSVPTDSERISLADIDQKQREQLFKGFQETIMEGGTRGTRIPAGLINAETYLKPGVVDGFVFQTRNEIMNNGTTHLRDVTGTYNDTSYLPGKKIVTEALIWGRGEFCTVQGQLGEYEDYRKLPKTCTKIADMSPADIDAVKQRAKTFGVELVDENLHTAVRNAAGQVIAQDVTKTLRPSYSLHSAVYGNTSIDSYEVATLNARGAIANVCTQDFKAASLPAGQIPDIVNNGQWKLSRDEYGMRYDSVANPLDEPHKITSRCETGDGMPGYQIRYMNDRFKAHGKTSGLPQVHRNTVERNGEYEGGTKEAENNAIAEMKTPKP